jgi:hypothetical protein
MTSRSDIVSNSFAASLIRRKARQLCRRPGFSRSDEDDLKQGMRLYLWSASRLFDPARGNVESFVVTALRSWTDMEVRRRRAGMRFTGVEDVSLDSTMVDRGDGELSPMSAGIGVEDADRRLGVERRGPASDLEFREDVALVEARLTRAELRFMRDVVDRGVAGAARKRRTSRRQVLARLAAIRERFADKRADGSSAA